MHSPDGRLIGYLMSDEKENRTSCKTIINPVLAQTPREGEKETAPKPVYHAFSWD